MPFLKQSVTIGRSRENDCVVNDPYVGRLHCRIDRMGDDRFFLTDLNSKNGTYVNGSRVSGGMEIGPYDTVRVGNTQVPWMPYFEREEVPEPEGGDNGGAVDVPPERSTVVPPIKETVIPPKKRNAALPWILLGILLLTAGLVYFLIVKPNQEESKQPDPISQVDTAYEKDFNQ